eukprot:gene25225-30467_t
MVALLIWCHGVGKVLSTTTFPTGQPTGQPSAQPFKVTYSRDRFINTYAGFSSSTYGSRGSEGMNAQYARLESPRGLYVDDAGNVYIGENGRIRKITVATNTITSVVGGASILTYNDLESPATSSYASSIYGLTGDSNGYLYFSDSDACRIRRVVLSTNIISTIAGAYFTCSFSGDTGQATSARLAGPRGLSIFGNVMFIADFNNHRIRMINLNTGIITTVAGTGSTGTSLTNNVLPTSTITPSPGNVLALSATTVLITDLQNCVIRTVYVGALIVASGGDGSCGATVVGTANARMNYPEALCGNWSSTYVFMRDSLGLYKVVSGVSTLWIGGSSNFLQHTGISRTSVRVDKSYGCAVDTAGNIYLSDYNFNFLWRMSTAGTMQLVVGYAGGVTVPKEYAAFGLITGMWENTVGDLYLAEYDKYRISMVRYADGMVSVEAGTGASGYVGDGVDATSTPISLVRAIAGDSSGNFYFTDYMNYRVRRVTTSSSIISTVVGFGVCAPNANFNGAGTSCCLLFPMAIAIDTLANLYVSDNSAVVRRMSLSTHIISTFAGSGVMAAPLAFDVVATSTSVRFGLLSSIWVDVSSGYIYLADITYTNVYYLWYDLTGNLIFTRFAGTGSFSADSPEGVFAKQWPIATPTGLMGDSGRNIYIAMYNSFRIRVVDKIEGRIYTYGGNGAYLTAGEDVPATVTPMTDPSHCPSSWPTSSFPSISLMEPSFPPTVAPSVAPTPLPVEISEPTVHPSTNPTFTLTNEPTQEPTESSDIPSSPTLAPINGAPSAFPSALPSLVFGPSAIPSLQPSALPSQLPVSVSFSPSAIPTLRPTLIPTAMPSFAPSLPLTDYPTGSPLTQPTISPLLVTTAPTDEPSKIPSSQPIMQLSAQPTLGPTPQPTVAPSLRTATLRMLTVQFTDDGSRLTVALNERTNCIVGSVFLCNALLVFPSSNLCSCVWQNESRVLVLDVNTKLPLSVGTNISLANSSGVVVVSDESGIPTLLDTQIDPLPVKIQAADSPVLPTIGARFTATYLPFCSPWSFDLTSLR